MFSIFQLLIFGLIAVTVICINDDEIIDLSWGIDETTLYWPGNRKFEFTKTVKGITPGGFWHTAREFCMAEHGGTHIDAPRHFNPNGLTVGQLTFSQLINRGATIDVSQEVKVHGSNFTLEVHHLEEWVKNNGPLDKKTILIVRYGWSEKYHNEIEYFGYDDHKNLNFPGISKEAAEWIAKIGTIVGVGIDTPSLDIGATISYPAHQELLKHQIFALENLKIPENIPVKDFALFVLPIKLMEGSGGPVRVFTLPLDKTLNDLLK